MTSSVKETGEQKTTIRPKSKRYGTEAVNREAFGTDHNVTPLVEFDWQVSVGLYPFGVGWVHH